MVKKPSPIEKTIRKGKEDDLFGPDLPLPFRKKIFLEIISESGKGKIIELGKGRVIIGRADADVVLEDPEISKKHAVLEALSRDNVFVRDLASTNGTFVNGVQISHRKITDGDIIRVGSTKLKFYTLDVKE